MDLSLELDRYLDRLGIGAPAADAEGLALLQQAQLRSIAFESIDPLLGRVPDLDPSAISDKLLRRGRGGYCFELNSLFGEALSALGFSATPVMARVHKPDTGPGVRSHLAWLVEADGVWWLADTGFGGPGARYPLLLEDGREDTQGHEIYRVSQDEDSGEIFLSRREGDDWTVLYGFEQHRVLPNDLAAANFLCARWDQAPFSSHLMLNRLTETGRVSVFDRAVTRVEEGARTREDIGSVNALAVLLREDFGLAVGDADIAAVAQKVGIPAD